ncbi:MAG TPA: helix-turn-helix domain-containing protein [Candidatus Moranbacteria bacterium]|nr:helix-turn-helix domain-containing protein [Candidatus Moranbacteria bacterium]
MQNKAKKSHISAPELAKKLKISRVTVFNRIKKGQIPAEKIGRNYIISMDVANEIAHGKNPPLTEEKKGIIKKAVEKTVKEYGETLKLLGKE